MPLRASGGESTAMLILDRSRALDRMIWTAGRHTVVVPEPFSSTITDAVSKPADDAPWHWSNEPSILQRGPRRLSSTVELREVAKRAS